MEGATSTSGVLPGGGSTRGAGGSHRSRTDEVHRFGPLARVFELREACDQTQLAADAPVQPGDRWQAEPSSGLVELAATLSQARFDKRVEAPPDHASGVGLGGFAPSP